MDKRIIQSIEKSVDDLIRNSTSSNKLKKIIIKHNNKIHFIPTKYRILGGILQSMNIQFGNFLENTIKNIVEMSPNNEILSKYSGKKSNQFLLSRKTCELIDTYITKCQIKHYADEELKLEYNQLLLQIIDNENTESEVSRFAQDIDLLFYNTLNKQYYYTEIKYNDDHDTGKFIDINRKFLKTFALLVRELKIKDVDTLKPILVYFNNKKMKGNIYLPEEQTIYRGQKFFDSFTDVKYEEIDNCFRNICENEILKNKFDELYRKIMKLKL